MSLYKYDRYKILLDPESHKTQGLQVDDVVRRQYLDGKNLIYSLMIVLQTGIDIILDKTGKELESSYFIEALIEGDEPVNGELLDFVRTTNLFNADRSGALYLTASDSEAPFMDIIDGMAFENSLCYPIMGEGRADEADSERYSCISFWAKSKQLGILSFMLDGEPYQEILLRKKMNGSGIGYLFSLLIKKRRNYE